MRIIHRWIDLSHQSGYTIGSTKEASLWHLEEVILTAHTAQSAGLQLLPKNGTGINEDAEEWLREWGNERTLEYIDRPIADFADAMYRPNSSLKLFGVAIDPNSVHLNFVCPDSPMLNEDRVNYGEYCLSLKPALRPAHYEFMVFAPRKGSEVPDQYHVIVSNDHTDVIEYRNNEEYSKARIEYEGNNENRKVVMYLEEYD